jgi:DNA-binding transcriptional MerR regulator
MSEQINNNQQKDEQPATNWESLTNFESQPTQSIDDFIAQVEGRTFDKEGGNSKAFLFEDKVLLYGQIDAPNQEDFIRETNALIASDVNIMPILQYKITSEQGAEGWQWATGWTLQERAKGKELHPERQKGIYIDEKMSDTDLEQLHGAYEQGLAKYGEELSCLAEASQEQIDRFVHGIIAIERSEHLQIDPSKSTNFFYDRDAGFGLIDINYVKNKSKFNDANSAEYAFWLPLNNLPTIRAYEQKGFIGGSSEEVSKLQEAYASLTEKIISSLQQEGFSDEQIKQAYNARGAGRGRDAYPLFDDAITEQRDSAEQLELMKIMRNNEDIRQKQVVAANSDNDAW